MEIVPDIRLHKRQKCVLDGALSVVPDPQSGAAQLSASAVRSEALLLYHSHSSSWSLSEHMCDVPCGSETRILGKTGYLTSALHSSQGENRERRWELSLKEPLQAGHANQ